MRKNPALAGLRPDEAKPARSGGLLESYDASIRDWIARTEGLTQYPHGFTQKGQHEGDERGGTFFRRFGAYSPLAPP